MLLDRCNTIVSEKKQREKRETVGVHYQGTRKMWILKLDHSEDE